VKEGHKKGLKKKLSNWKVQNINSYNFEVAESKFAMSFELHPFFHVPQRGAKKKLSNLKTQNINSYSFKATEFKFTMSFKLHPFFHVPQRGVK